MADKSNNDDQNNTRAKQFYENGDAHGEDIPEEEVVCIICFVELSEGGQTFKLECSCRGELALAHQECAVKWFSIKGNKTCDICKQEISKLACEAKNEKNALTKKVTNISNYGISV